jgi:hypothetical protein
MSYIPSSGKAELHITYRCNLQCVNCNRGSYLREPHTPDMTVADVMEFFRQCRELNWKPAVLLIGGEPTMHPDFDEIVALSRAFAGNDLVQVWSNGRDRSVVDSIRKRYAASVPEESFKDKSRIDFPWDDYFVSPADYGIERHKCWQHGSEICGISVDSQGYMPCAVGGMIDGMLKLGIRTKRLSDLFDENINAVLTKEMCKHCGACLTQLLSGKEKDAWRDYVGDQPKRFGSRMSPTWHEATKDMK